MIPTLSDSIDTHSSVKAAISWEIKKCRFDASDSALQLHFGGRLMVYVGSGTFERRVLISIASIYHQHCILSAQLAYRGRFVDPKLQTAFRPHQGPCVDRLTGCAHSWRYSAQKRAADLQTQQKSAVVKLKCRKTGVEVRAATPPAGWMCVLACLCNIICAWGMQAAMHAAAWSGTSIHQHP